MCAACPLTTLQSGTVGLKPYVKINSFAKNTLNVRALEVLGSPALFFAVLPPGGLTPSCSALELKKREREREKDTQNGVFLRVFGRVRRLWCGRSCLVEVPARARAQNQLSPGRGRGCVKVPLVEIEAERQLERSSAPAAFRSSPSDRVARGAGAHSDWHSGSCWRSVRPSDYNRRSAPN